MEFAAPLLYHIFCVFLFVHCSDATCEANGKTYNVGETWQETPEHQDCFQHVCLQDGTYTTNECDELHNDVKDASVDDLDKSVLTTTEVTTDNQDTIIGCPVDDRVAGVGEEVPVPGRCVYRACAGNQLWIMKACAQIALTPGWIKTPEDVSKSYPMCCGTVKPLLDIIPDVVQSLQWSVALKIAYDNNSVDYGNELTPTQVKEEPAINYMADPDSLYLLSLVDPDAPSRQNATSREFLHWLVANIPGNDVSSGDVLAEYVGSGPPRGTGLHRYVYLLYQQPGNITFEEPLMKSSSVEGRRKFSISRFAQNYNLSDPIALNFFTAQYDDYVPEVHKQLGILV